MIKSGKGAQPQSSDCVTVNYKGSFIDGNVFDQSKPGQPITFPVQGVIKGWTMALQMMHVGDEWMLFIPSTLAYGDRGTPDGTDPRRCYAGLRRDVVEDRAVPDGPVLRITD